MLGLWGPEDSDQVPNLKSSALLCCNIFPAPVVLLLKSCAVICVSLSQ